MGFEEGRMTNVQKVTQQGDYDAFWNNVQNSTGQWASQKVNNVRIDVPQKHRNPLVE